MRDTITHALSVAADTFRRNAQAMRHEASIWGQSEAKREGCTTLAEQFEEQEKATLAAHALLSEGVLIAFSTDGPAFQSGFALHASADLLEGLARRLRHGPLAAGSVLCPNSNEVGFWDVEHTDAEAVEYDGPAAADGYTVEEDPAKPGAWIMDNADFGDLGESYPSRAEAWIAAEDHRERSAHAVECARRDNSSRCTCGLTS